MADTPMKRQDIWTPDEERHLIYLYSSGLLIGEISRRLGRSRNAVKSKAWDIRRRGIFLPYALNPKRRKRQANGEAKA